MDFTCDQPDCTFATGGRCLRANEFANPQAECPNINPLAALLDDLESDEPSLVGDPAPWAGAALSIDEADQLAQARPMRTIAVLGPPGSGKTCLLASIFLQLAAGQRGAIPYRFAGSQTLLGFRDLCERAAQWTGDDTPIVEPSPVEARFLHLMLRSKTRPRLLDLLFSDMRGASIDRWVTRVDDTTRRAMHFVTRADAIWLVIDGSALSGATKWTADAAAGRLIDRLAPIIDPARCRHVTLVFTRADLGHPPPPANGRVMQSLKGLRAAGHAVATHRVSAFPGPLSAGQPIGIAPLFAALIDQLDQPRVVSLPPEALPTNASWFDRMAEAGR